MITTEIELSIDGVSIFDSGIEEDFGSFFWYRMPILGEKKTSELHSAVVSILDVLQYKGRLLRSALA